MASTSGIVALKALLAKQVYSEKLSTLSDVKAVVEACHPSLEVDQVEISNQSGTSRWVIVCLTKFSRQGSPVKPRVLQQWWLQPRDSAERWPVDFVYILHVKAQLAKAITWLANSTRYAISILRLHTLTLPTSIFACTLAPGDETPA